MGAILDALHRLQTVERQIAAQRRQADNRKRQADVLRRQIEARSAAIAAKDSDRRAKQMEFDRMDLDAKTQDASIAKHRDALNKARTNKEYAAIITAINTERADNSKNENRQLELLGEFEALRQEVTQLHAQQETAGQQLAAAEKQYQDHLQSTAAERARLARQRDEVAGGIPPTVRATFERVAERHDGEAMGELVRLHPKREEYACGGCNMTLTREQVSALRSRDEIQTCGTCGRILHLTLTPPGRA